VPRHALDVVLQGVWVAKDAQVEPLKEQAARLTVRFEGGDIALMNVAAREPFHADQAAGEVELSGDLLELRHRAPPSLTKKRPLSIRAAYVRARYLPDARPKYPQQDSNLRFRLRRPTLYPLSYGGENDGIISLRARRSKLGHQMTGPKLGTASPA
jgi:hypothetical protein